MSALAQKARSAHILGDVRFYPNSGHRLTTLGCLLSAKSGHRVISVRTSKSARFIDTRPRQLYAGPDRRCDNRNRNKTPDAASSNPPAKIEQPQRLRLRRGECPRSGSKPPGGIVPRKKDSHSGRAICGSNNSACSTIRAPAGSPAKSANECHERQRGRGWHKHSAKAESAGEACNHQRGCVTS